MSKILITGATGFIGSHLTEICLKNNLEVVAYDRYNPNNNRGWLENSKYLEDINFILGDIRDYDSVIKAMDGCSAVFHLAALIGIPYSYISPLAYIRTNLEGTYNVLEASKKLCLEQVLITSTSETYGTAKYAPIDELHPVVGQSPYSASKIAADQLAISYYKSFGLPIKIVRPFNTYGPRQSARAIIPTVISQVIDNKSDIKIGNLNPTRDLTFVEDTVLGFLEIYKSNNLFGEVINIGMCKEISMGDLIEKIFSLMNSSLDVISEPERVRPQKSEVNQLLCNNEKILKNTNWKPQNNLEEGLKKTIDWMLKNMKFFKSKDYNI